MKSDQNVVSPAEGNLHLANIWPVGTRLGLVALYHLSAGVLVGMQIFTFIFHTYPYCLYFYRGTCICETVTAPVTLTNKWINILPSFSKLENGLLELFGGPGL